jgi:hypothetical protein
MNNELGSILVNTALWGILCVFVERKIKGDSKDDHDIKNRVVSVVHGLITFTLATYYILFSSDGFCAKNNERERSIIRISVSYFIYDFIACLYYGIYDQNLVIHHTSAITGFLIAMFSENGAKISILGLMIAESSNFPMHARIILRMKGLRYTRLFTFFETAYLLVYLAFRGLLCPLNIWYALTCRKTPIMVTVMCLVLSLQSYYFISQMFGIIHRKWVEMKMRRRNGVHMFWFSHNPALNSLPYVKKDVVDNIF